MYYTGIDLHKKTSFITSIDEKGKVLAKANLPNRPEIILKYFADLGRETKVVIESTSSWYWLYDLLSGKGIKVIISNPAKTKAIASAKIKNDKVDSHMLAQLLRADLIAPVYVSSLEIRELKELLRHRARLVRDVTRIKNRIHHLLLKNNLQVPYSDLFGKKGLIFLNQVSLPDYHQPQLQSYLQLYHQLREQIAPLDMALHQLAKKDKRAKLLMSIPGIGTIVAMTIVAEIEDISRFPSYRHLASYSGLVPSLEASAEKERRGKITKEGSSYLRTALIEAAQVIPRLRSCRLNLFFRKRVIKSGYKKAIVATAHKILQFAYYIWKNQTPYQEIYSPVV